MSSLLLETSERPRKPQIGARIAQAARAGAAPLGFLLAAIVLTKLALTSLLFPAAIFYVVGFSLLAWHLPGVALMLIFASAPFQNDLSGGGGAKFSIAEVNLMLTLPVLYLRCLIGKQRLHVGPILLPVLLYFAVCILSSMIHWRGGTALISLIQMFLYFVVAVLVFCVFAPDPNQYRMGFYALVLVGVFLTGAALVTNYWFIGLNKNGIAASLACCFLVCVELVLSADSRKQQRRLLAALGIIGVGLLFSLGRGAWLGTLAGVVFIFVLRRQVPLLIRIALMLLPLLALFWFTLPQSSRDYTFGFGQEHYNIKLRYDSIALAQNYFHESPIYGMGVGLRKDYDATNIILMTLAETGVLGVVTLLLIHTAFFQMIWRSRERIGRSEPIFSLLCIGGALVLDKLVHGMVDHYWSRGAIMAAWASAGMATRAYYIAVARARAASVPWREVVMQPRLEQAVIEQNH